MKKLLFIGLCLVLFISSLAGCGGKRQVSESNVEEVELSVFQWQLASLSNDNETEIAKVIREKTGVKIKPIASDANTWEEKLNSLIASGSTPDVFLNYGPIERQMQFNRWIKEGILLNFDEYVKGGKYPNLQKALDRFRWMKPLQQDGNYCLPVATYLEDKDAVVNSAYLVRQDWLENLGLKHPTNIDEFYSMLKAFVNNDPDKNGEKDTFGLTSNNGIYRFNLIYNAFGASLNRWEKANNTWTPEVISEDMKEAVKFLRKLYVEKILDPDFVVNTTSQVTEKFISGKAGLIYSSAGVDYYNGYYSKFEKVYTDKNPSEMFDYMPVLNGKDGQRVDGVSNFWLVSSINANADKNKIEKAVGLYEFLLSEEGINLLRYGVKDIHYKEENGKKASVIPNDSNGKAQTLKKYDPMAYLIMLFTGDAGFDNRIEMAKNEEAIKGIGQYMEKAVIDPLRDVVVQDEVFSSAMANELTQYAVEQITNMILSTNDIDADFAKFVEGYNKKGGTDYIKAMNEVAKKAGK